MFDGRSPSPHASEFFLVHSRCRKILDFLDQGCRDDMDANIFRVIYVCGIPSNVFCSPYWHETIQAINVALKDTRASRMTKPKPWDYAGKEPKSIMF
jgi:hypothetical protein